jgi:hypothetical protein
MKGKVSFEIKEKECEINITAKDWAGLVDVVAGIIHRRKFNITFLKGEVVEDDIAKLIIKIGFKNEDEKQKFLTQMEEMKRKIENVLEYDPAMIEILKTGIIKIEKFKETLSAVFEQIKNEPEEEKKNILKEAEYFFSSRSWSYIEERSPFDLAKQIITNYKFQKEVKEKNELMVKVENIKTTRENLTCITVAWWDRNLHLDFLLDILREILPNFKRKFDKQFTTPDGITIIRLEITDENENPLPFENHAFIENYIKTHLKKFTTMGFEKIRISPEIIGRILLPKLIEETKKTSIPHVYFFLQGVTREYFYLKTIFVIETKSEIHLKKLLEIIESNENISILSIKPPSKSDGVEVNIVDLRISRKNIPFYEQIYNEIKEIFKNVLGNYRDFDEGLRQIEIKNLNEVIKILSSSGIEPNNIKKFFYNLDEFYRTSREPKEIAESLKFMWDTLKSTISEGGLLKINKKEIDNSLIICIAGKGADDFFKNFIEYIPEEENYILKFEEFSIPLYLLILKKTKEIEEFFKKEEK